MKLFFEKSLAMIFAFALLLSTATVFTTSCGQSTDAKEKAKKSKKKKALDDEEEEETAADAHTADSHAKKNEKHEEVGKQRDPEVIWKELMEGNKRFVGGKHTVVNFASVRKETANGQHPEVMILGCADSRVPPELVFDKNIGELFVVRAAGNVADLVELGSLEYAYEHLHATVLVVLGHQSCGAVAAAVSGEEMPTKNLRAIVSRIQPAMKGSNECPIGEKPNDACIVLNAKHSAENVLEKSQVLKEAVESGKLKVITAMYKLETGEIQRLN